MAVKRRYFVFLCPTCGQQFQYAGWCDSCGARLASTPVIPVETIHESFEDWASQASSVPVALVGHFVEHLLEFAKRPCG